MVILTIVVLVVIAMLVAPIYIHQRRSLYDLRQLVIYGNVVDRLAKQSMAGDIPRDEVLIILNAAKDTYNESVQKRKNIQKTPFPEVHFDEVVGVDPRNEIGSKGKKSKGKQPNRPTRSKLDSNTQG